MSRFIAHQMAITPVGPGGSITGRYQVFCLTCDLTVHEATTAPDIHIREHLATCMDCGQRAERGACGYKHTCGEHDTTAGGIVCGGCGSGRNWTLIAPPYTHGECQCGFVGPTVRAAPNYGAHCPACKRRLHMPRGQGCDCS